MRASDGQGDAAGTAPSEAHVVAEIGAARSARVARDPERRRARRPRGPARAALALRLRDRAADDDRPRVEGVHEADAGAAKRAAPVPMIAAAAASPASSALGDVAGLERASARSTRPARRAPGAVAARDRVARASRAMPRPERSPRGGRAAAAADRAVELDGDVAELAGHAVGPAETRPPATIAPPMPVETVR